MLSKKHRLSKSADVKQTTARGRSFFNSYFVLKIAPSKEEAKVTFITSVKVSKKAVDRNRVKRILREEMRKSITQFKPGNYVFIIKRSAVSATPTELREALQKSLVTAKVLQTTK